jgi:TRAP-type C4-dicarboxylate transport system permease small subunit
MAAPDLGERLAALAQVRPATDPASRFANALGERAMWLFLVAVLLSVWEVVARYQFSAPSTWIHATTTTLCAVGFALGGAYSMARREHINITLLPDRLPARGKRVIALLSLGIGAFYLAGFSYAMWLDVKLALWRFDFTGAWSPELTPGPPNWPLPSIGKVALFAGALLFLVVVLVQFWRTLRGRTD